MCAVYIQRMYASSRRSAVCFSTELGRVSARGIIKYLRVHTSVARACQANGRVPNGQIEKNVHRCHGELKRISRNAPARENESEREVKKKAQRRAVQTRDSASSSRSCSGEERKKKCCHGIWPGQNLRPAGCRMDSTERRNDRI